MSYYLAPNFPDMSQSDFVVLYDQFILWFNQTKLEYGPQMSMATENSDQPLPEAQFPFRRLGLALGLNGSEAYVYHQINDSVIAEELWNDSEFWQPSKNISTRT